jgi:hypothetical protein
MYTYLSRPGCMKRESISIYAIGSMANTIFVTVINFRAYLFLLLQVSYALKLFCIEDGPVRPESIQKHRVCMMNPVLLRYCKRSLFIRCRMQGLLTNRPREYHVFG